MSLKLMISAAEVSGDVHGAYLAKELKNINKDIELFGMGGEQMAAAGVDVKFDITDTSTIGIFEPLKYLPNHLKSFNILKKLMKSENPDALIVIDAQGFHMPLVKEARKLGIKTIYYIAPQEWLWGTKRGVRKVAKELDLIVAIFEKEYEAYKETNAHVIFFGHPLVDIAKPAYTKGELRLSSYIKNGAPFIGLFPGSRKQEIDGLLPIMLDALKLIQDNFGDINPLIGLSSSKFKAKIEKMVEERKLNVSIVEGGTYDTLAACDVSLAASGTLLLEAAIVGAPVIMTYKLSPFTAFVAKHIIRIDKKLSFYSMPNILANEKIIPEFVMDNANAENLANEAISILKDKTRAAEIKHGLKQVNALLGNPGVVSKVARGIIDFLLK